MKTQRDAIANEWILRPKQKKMSMPDYISLMSRLYGNNDEATPEQMEGLRKRLENARAFTGPSEERFNDKIQKQGKYEVKPKKKIKKVADSSLVSPQGPLPYNLDKWLDSIMPQWWEIEHDRPLNSEEEARRKLILDNRQKVAEGIETLLHLRRI